MKYFTILYYLLILFICFTACKKDKEPNTKPNETTNTPVDTFYDYKYIITLNPDKTLSNIKLYHKLTLKYTEDFTYSSNTIKVITTVNNQITKKILYTVKDNIAEKSIDTLFKGSDSLIITNRSYTHNSEKQLIESLSNEYIIIIGDTIKKENFTYSSTYKYQNGNFIPNPRGPNQCTDAYSYNEIIPALNVNYLYGKITGLTSRNLITGITYNLGCPGGPSYTYPKSQFIYKLNAENYVIRKEEKFLRGYSGTAGYAIEPKITVTVYEYIK